MAVPSSPVPRSQSKKKMEVSESTQQKEQEQEVGTKQKRSKCPGVRVVGGRIYDSQNGKTCHQCRQKTMDFTARCKNMKNDKQCTIMFCHKCLLNRYGEEAEEMAARDDWHCPKCRDICNCSVCMKKKGFKPTGIMVHAAKATGFSSVSELLHIKGSDGCQEMVAKAKMPSPKKSTGSDKVQPVTSPNKRGKENAFDGACNINASSKPSDSSLDEKKAKKIKGERLKEQVEVPHANGIVSKSQMNNEDTVLRRSPRKSNLQNEITSLEVKKDDGNAGGLRRSPRKSNIPQEVAKKDQKIDNNKSVAPPAALIAEPKKKKKSEVLAEAKEKADKFIKDSGISDYVMDIALPPGTLMVNVAGIDLVPEDVGYALQFLEFCAAFGEVLGIKKGQPENVLRDIMIGRRRKGKCSSAVQFFDQLLSFMFKDTEEDEEEEEDLSGSSPTNGETAWINSLKRCLSESDLEIEDLPEGWFNKGYDGYERLDSSQKLRLLTFLCDETLSVEEMRKWMEDQNSKLIENRKEVKENTIAAKDKAKVIKRRMQEETVKALIARNGVPLTVSEHDSLVLEIKAEVDRVQEEMLEAMGLASNKRKRADAVRTEPIIVDCDGRAFWKLKGFADTCILLQDMGALEQVVANDRWFSYDDDEEVKVVEKFISSVRLKKHRSSKLIEQPFIKKRGSDIVQDLSINKDSPTATNN